MDALCLSLGHNSSAILVRDGEILCGYETERFSRVKSDSAFPQAPIEEITRRYNISNDVEIIIGHWALDGQLSSMSAKHWNPAYIKDKFPGGQIQSLDSNSFTHHDSHAYSALAFVESSPFPEEETYVLVMDGFGTMGENLSVYRVYGNIPVLLNRKFGFGTSMGLFYQYTTAYLGMKQNQDEYKLLAYEAHIEDAKSYINGLALDSQIRKWTEYFCGLYDKFETEPRTDPLINIGALPQFAKRVSDIHDSVLTELGFASDDIRLKRIIISYFTQAVVEGYVEYVISSFHPKNLILVGGLFYNVKLNSMISRLISGKISIMPLAGDQGAALGIYHAKYNLTWPNHLFWGERDLHLTPDELPQGIIAIDNDHEAMEYAYKIISRYGFVNVVRGAMEFGPRALCHTTTFALPDSPNAEYINVLNNRTNEMPFAPVITPGMLDRTFNGTDKVHKSLEYMVITRDYKDYNQYPYAAHLDVNRGEFTGRPQVTHDPEVIGLLSKFNGVLINTSYNFHGVPIVNSWGDIIHTHNQQLKHAGQVKPITIVMTGDLE